MIFDVAGNPLDEVTVRLKFFDNTFYRTSGEGYRPGYWSFAPLAPGYFHTPITFQIDLVLSEESPVPVSDSVVFEFVDCEIGGRFVVDFLESY